MFDVYNILDFLPTNNEANQIIDVFDRVTSGLEREPVLDKIRAEITKLQTYKMFYGEDAVYVERDDVLEILDRYKESEG